MSSAGLHRCPARRDGFGVWNNDRHSGLQRGSSSSAQVSARSIKRGCYVAQLALARVFFAGAAVDEEIAFGKVNVSKYVRDAAPSGQQQEQEGNQHVGPAALNSAVRDRVRADCGCCALPQANHLGTATVSSQWKRKAQNICTHSGNVQDFMATRCAVAWHKSRPAGSSIRAESSEQPSCSSAVATRVATMEALSSAACALCITQPSAARSVVCEGASSPSWATRNEHRRSAATYALVRPSALFGSASTNTSQSIKHARLHGTGRDGSARLAHNARCAQAPAAQLRSPTACSFTVSSEPGQQCARAAVRRVEASKPSRAAGRRRDSAVLSCAVAERVFAWQHRASGIARRKGNVMVACWTAHARRRAAVPARSTRRTRARLGMRHGCRTSRSLGFVLWLASCCTVTSYFSFPSSWRHLPPPPRARCVPLPATGTGGSGWAAVGHLGRSR